VITRQPSSRARSAVRKWAFRLVAATLVPAVLLGLVEGGLRLAGSGYDTDFFLRMEGRDAYTGNPRFGWRFFPRPLARAPDPMFVPAEKAAGTVRIFVLGGSAARGEADEAFSFSRFLEVMLRDCYPETRFEVFNVAMAAINSHVVLPIARDCAEHDPDLFVVYMGNNEVVGPFGAGTVLKPYSPSLGLIRAGLWLKTTKLGQLLEAATLPIRDRETTAEWRGLAMFVEQQVAADDPRLEKVYAHFRKNLSDICGAGANAGAKVILCTVAVNLEDCPPFASLHRAGLSEGELRQWETHCAAAAALEEAGDAAGALRECLAAAQIDDRHAELRFRLARCHLRLGEAEEAKRGFALARDLDALRFRADTRVNRIVREVAAEHARGVALADAERDLGELPGEEFFYEHVHLTPEGSHALARGVFRQVVALLPASVRRGAHADPEPPSMERCEELLALTAWDRHRMLSRILEMVERPPFTSQLGHEEQVVALRRRLAERQRQTTPEALAEAAGTYRRALATATDDLLRRNLFGELQMERGKHLEAATHFKMVLGRLPGHLTANGNCGAALLAADRLDEAKQYFDRYLAIAERSSLAYRTEAHNRIAFLYVRKGMLGEAEQHCRRALEMAPGQAETLGNLAEILIGQGKADEGIQKLLEAARLNPDDVHTQVKLGIVRLRQGRLDQALLHLRAALALAPTHAPARAYLALALGRKGLRDEADREYAEAIRMDPGNAAVRSDYGDLLLLRGKTAEAERQYREALSLDPQWSPARNGLAWLLATGPDPSSDRSADAVQLALSAVAATKRENAAYLDTLAAAYAAAGRFRDAVAVAEETLEKAEALKAVSLAAQVRKRLRLYRAGKAFRVSPRPPSND